MSQTFPDPVLKNGPYVGHYGPLGASGVAGLGILVFWNLSSCVDTLYTFRDNMTHYKTESVHLLGTYALSN